MLQKRNDFDIIELLRKEPMHVRQAAQELKLIPSTTLRMLKSLQKQNIVDFKRQGRNTTYFIKDTPEAKNYLLMAEEYKRIRILQQPTLRRVYKELIEATNGELIVLFGSHAKNYATAQSDIDIFIETQDKKLKERLENISEKLSIQIGVLDKNSGLGKEIIKNHIIFQNTERFYQLLR